MLRLLAIVCVFVGGVSGAWAQSERDETLADIRQELSLLYYDMQRLKRELSTTGASTGSSSGGVSVLERMDAMEMQLQRLTGRTEELENWIGRIVADGTNRVGDLEFRLVELEGGDIGALGETSTLGGDGLEVPVAPVDNGGDATELAVGERADFDRARAALDSGEMQSAADQFTAFTETYPGSPLEAEAHLRRGQALEGLGSMTDGARAYLKAYSMAPAGPAAAESLFNLGRSLGALEQINEACVTLGEVQARFPGSPMVSEAVNEMATLGCS